MIWAPRTPRGLSGGRGRGPPPPTPAPKNRPRRHSKSPPRPSSRRLLVGAVYHAWCGILSWTRSTHMCVQLYVYFYIDAHIDISIHTKRQPALEEKKATRDYKVGIRPFNAAWT